MGKKTIKQEPFRSKCSRLSSQARHMRADES